VKAMPACSSILVARVPLDMLVVSCRGLVSLTAIRGA